MNRDKDMDRRKATDPFASSGIDRTAPGDQIEIQGMKRVSPLRLDYVEGACLTLSCAEEANRLRDGLRGSVIEADLQSLCQREDGVQLLTGHGSTSEALAALEAAGLETTMLATIHGWRADEIAVHFVDARSAT